MNLQSEIQYFSELSPASQARLVAGFLYELTVEARVTYGAGPEDVKDPARLRFVNELTARLVRYVAQVLIDEPGRASEDALVRMLLAPRVDKAAERMVLNAYRRTIQGFDRDDTTVTMSPR